MVLIVRPHHFLLVVCSNSIAILHRYYCIYRLPVTFSIHVRLISHYFLPRDAMHPRY